MILRINRSDNFSKTAIRTSIICMCCNLFLCLIKIIGSLVSGSKALFSDGLNSGFDVISGVIVVIGAAIAGKQADKEHPYGHERFECVAAILLSVMLLVTAVFVGHTVIEDLRTQAYKTAQVPGILSVAAAIVSIITKEVMFRYTRSNAEKINSAALRAEAWDNRADVISTAGALIGIVFTRFGYPVGDMISSLVVCLFILRTACMVFIEAIGRMTDRSCGEEKLSRIRECIVSHEGVLAIDKLQVRTFGSRLYIDLEIAEDGSITLAQAHAVAEKVHDSIEHRFPEVKHIMIHVNPRV